MTTYDQNNIQKALINPQPPVEYEKHVAEILTNIEQFMGFIPDGLRLYGISPPLLETFVGNISYFNMGGTNLPKVLTAMIRYLVSWDSGCHFCIDLNEGYLSNMGVDLDDVRKARNNPDIAPLNDHEKVLLKLALKAVNTPELIGESDLDRVREQGWQDRDIFDAVAQAANNRAFNYILRTFKIEQQGAFA